VRSVKEECLSHLILFGERSLTKALIQFQEHYHEERNHHGKNNVLLFPAPAPLEPVGDLASVVKNALAAYSGTTVAPHEYFDQTGCGRCGIEIRNRTRLVPAGTPRQALPADTMI
jgi:hypothetical protein